MPFAKIRGGGGFQQLPFPFPLFKEAADSARARGGEAVRKKGAGEEIHGGGWRSKLPIVKKEEKDGIALCGDFGGV